MYNVLEKLRAGEALNPKEKQIHDTGLVSVLRQPGQIPALLAVAGGAGRARRSLTLVQCAGARVG